MPYKLIHRLIGAIVFLIALITLFSTVQPSVSFWDCGELAAASYGLQVSHPPGAPFFSLVNKIFSLVPFASNIGFRINSLTVVASSFTILFLYLVGVKLIENYKGRNYKNVFDALFTFLSAAVAALVFNFCDTFWFNGIESNVFGFSTFLFASIVFLAMKWNEKSTELHSTKYLLLIAFIIGLSPGVHLMSVPSIMPVVMLVILKKYITDEETCIKTAYLFIVHMLILLIIAVFLWASQTGSQPPSPEDVSSFDSKFKIIMVVISLAFVGILWKKLLVKNSFYIPIVVGAVALFIAYPGIVKLFPKIVGTLSGDSLMVAIFIIAIILLIFGYIIWWSQKNNKPTVNIIFASLTLALIGFTTYTTIMIRASQNPPMNENDPHTFQDLMYYLGREQYGEMPTFKRRYSQEPQHQTTYANYSSDLEFIWKYQMNHMYNRYIGWNFLGKESFDQDAGVNITKFYGIPLILILLGLYMHFKRDWKMATVFLFMFIIMGYMICYYQVQQEPQPRERIYFYAGAFFTFAAWISIAMREIIDFISKKIKSINAARTTSFVVIGLILILGPYTMFTKNYFTHDRSKNWLPWDYAYNILQSCAPNAVLFTCGDNDTFCLWYLQDVEGVRRDIRVANLSLINTNWYGKQLRDNTPYNTDKVAMNYTDLQIDKLQPQEWPASKDITLPVTPDVYAQFGIKDTSITKNSSITFKMPSSMNYGKRSFVRVQDLMIKDIVEANKWKRPIYFAITCGPDSKIGLDDYLVQEGMTERLVPYKKSPDVKKMVNVEFMRKQLFEENPGYSIDYKPGFKYRGLNDKSVFYDDNMERSIAGYRKSFITLARYYLDSYKDTIQCRYTIEKMQEKIPKEVVKYDIFSLYSLMDLYNKLGDNTYIDIAKEIETSLLKMLSDNPKNKGVSNELIRIRDIISGKQKPSREFDE